MAINLCLQAATVFASDNGLKVTVEESKCVLANAFIQAALFQEFTIREEHIVFRINLTVLMVSLISYFMNHINGHTTEYMTSKLL
jgi:cell cycle checkpoint protein